MNLEGQNFNPESDAIKQERFDPYFLQEQIRLPKSQWDEKFINFVEQLTGEKQKNEQENSSEQETSPEFWREQTLKRYMGGLDLSKDELKDKKILDLGCGDGEFVKSLIEKGITRDAYGIDAKLNESAIEDRYKINFVRGNFEESLPIKNVDYVISFGAVTNGIWGGEEIMDMRSIIRNSAEALKADGKILFYPIQEAAFATPLEGYEKSKQKWEELLAEISTKYNIEYEFEPRNIKISGVNNDVILESALIIHKKKNYESRTITTKQRA